MNTNESIVKGILVVLLGLAFVAISAWIFSVVSHKIAPDKSDDLAHTAIVCPPDFSSYIALAGNSDRVVKLVGSRKAMHAENGGFVNSQVVITKNETKESKVACGYLFVRAGTGTNNPLQSWENVYINPNDFGGHINPKDQVGPGDVGPYSEYLFPLNRIQYWKTRAERARGNLSNADWAALLNVSERVSFTIALNTTNESGFIDELSIAYKCWNPATGEENVGCKLSVTGSKDEQTVNPIQ